MRTQPDADGTEPQAPQRAVRVAAAVGGQVLGTLFGAVAAVRGTKPLHPVGELRRAALEVDPAPGVATGVPLLDTPGTHHCLVRTSRAAGLPTPLPDVQGLALRVLSPGAAGDVLFASTGTGRLSRHCLVVRRQLGGGPLTTLIPVRAPSGPLLLGLFPRPVADTRADEFDLRRSHPGGSWCGVGLLRLGDLAGDEQDPPVRFDPVRHPVPGLEHAPAWAALRAPPYAAARTGYPARSVPGLE